MIFLSWDTPDSVLASPMLKVKVMALRPEATQQIVLTPDSVWNFAIDEETSTTDSQYQIIYQSEDGSTLFYIEDADIQRMLPSEQCLISFDCLNSMGFPMRGVRVTLQNPRTLALIKEFFTNSQGNMQFPCKYGANVQIYIEGDIYALDTAIPAQPEASLNDLVYYGTRVFADRRGLM